MFTRPRHVVLLATATVCFFAGLAGTASAHGPEGTFTPITNEPVEGELAANLRVTLIYNNDDDPVDDATVQVIPTNAEGVAGAEATLPRAAEPGTYEGVVPVAAPGAWTFAVTSEEPEASTEFTVTIPEPPPATTVAPTTVAPTTVAPTTEAPTTTEAPAITEDTDTTEPGDVGTAASVDRTDSDEPSSGDSDEGGFPWGIAVIVAIVAAAVAMIMAYAMRPGAEDEEDDAADENDAAPPATGGA